jgi:hypothetical protein
MQSGQMTLMVTSCSPTPLQHSQILPMILPVPSQAAQVIRSVASTTQVPAQVGQLTLVVNHGSISPSEQRTGLLDSVLLASYLFHVADLLQRI